MQQRGKRHTLAMASPEEAQVLQQPTRMRKSGLYSVQRPSGTFHLISFKYIFSIIFDFFFQLVSMFDLLLILIFVILLPFSYLFFFFFYYLLHVYVVELPC